MYLYCIFLPLDLSFHIGLAVILHDYDEEVEKLGDFRIFEKEVAAV